jgi:hypothetical protein
MSYEAKKAIKMTLGLDRIDSHNDFLPARTLWAGSRGTFTVAASVSEGILDMVADSVQTWSFVGRHSKRGTAQPYILRQTLFVPRIITPYPHIRVIAPPHGLKK